MARGAIDVLMHLMTFIPMAVQPAHLAHDAVDAIKSFGVAHGAVDMLPMRPTALILVAASSLA